jgi:uncharacterized membrane protein YsdA (DUF1294 family)
MIQLPSWLLALLAWHALASLIAFAAFGIDKNLARRGMRRIRERTLHAFALAGGWPGALAGRAAFRHKTIDRRFSVTLGVIVLLHAAIWATVAMLAMSGCAARASRSLVERTVAETTPHEFDAPVIVRTERGLIDIAPDPTLDAAHVEAVLRAPNEEVLARSTIRTTRTAEGALLVEPAWDEEVGRRTLLEAEISVRLPRVADIRAETPGGRIRIRDAAGQVFATTGFGEILVSLRNDNPGPVLLRSEEGTVRLSVGEGFRGVLEAIAPPERILLTAGVRANAEVGTLRTSLDEENYTLLFGPRAALEEAARSHVRSGSGFVVIDFGPGPAPEAPAGARTLDPESLGDGRE